MLVPSAPKKKIAQQSYIGTLKIKHDNIAQ